MGPPLVRTYLPEFRRDLLELEDANLQRRVLTIWTDVTKGLMAGIPLAHLACLLPNRVEAVSVEAIAVGERRALRVYVAAARRLGRLNDDRQ
jgi:hypothetical protein